MALAAYICAFVFFVVSFASPAFMPILPGEVVQITTAHTSSHTTSTNGATSSRKTTSTLIPNPTSGPLPELEAVKPIFFGNINFKPSGAWTTIPCGKEPFDDLTQPIAKSWELSGASEALEQALKAWSEYKNSTSDEQRILAFTDYAYNAFHGPPMTQCWTTAGGKCQAPECTETMTAAGYLIMSSLAFLNNMIAQIQTELLNARLDMMQNLWTFSEDFAPLPNCSDNSGMSTFLTILGAVGDLSVGFEWGSILNTAEKAIDKTIVHETEGAAKSGIQKMSVSAFDFAKTVYGTQSSGCPDAGLEELTQEGTLSTVLNQYYENVANAQTIWLGKLLNQTFAESYGPEYLMTLLENGTLYTIQEAENYYTINDMQTNAQQLMSGVLIKAAWELSATPQNPFVLRVDRQDYHCGAPLSDACKQNPQSPALSALCDNMDPDIALDTQICDDEGNTWFLLNGVYDAKPTCTPYQHGCLPGPRNYAFGKLAGGDNILLSSANNNTGGLTLQDLITSSYAGFQENQNQNGYTILPNTTMTAASNFSITEGSIPYEGGVNTPGFFNFTICLSAEEAMVTLIQGDSSKPPCGKIPQRLNMSPPPSSAGYTPGWCYVHIWQFAPDSSDPDADLTKAFEVEVELKDHAGQKIGYATKQWNGDPLIMNTSLPFNFIVETSPKWADDTDTICMWYSDQFFCSNSTSHQCKFGQYDGGMRQGDCGFSCPGPNVPAPSSTAQPRPTGGGTTALNGAPTSFTAISTAPLASWTPSFTQGWCGIHVRQYQKNENPDGDHENPYPNYSLEVTVYDAAKPPNIIIHPWQQQVPNWTKETLQGPLKYPLYVGVGAVDSDNLTFAYNGQNWTSASTSHFSSFGAYVGGHRDGDTGFEC